MRKKRETSDREVKLNFRRKKCQNFVEKNDYFCPLFPVLYVVTPLYKKAWYVLKSAKEEKEKETTRARKRRRKIVKKD